MPKDFEINIDYKFTNKEILTEALTHSSYANEHKINKVKDNERLEFLGDAILDLVVSEFLYKKHKDLPEGDLSKLRASIVCEAFLLEAAKEIRLGDFLLLGKGEELTGGRERTSVLADAFEAVIAAIYLDGGIEESEKFIHRFIITYMESLSNDKKIEDYKTHLQEIIQKDSKNPISYVLINEKGPDHDKYFEVEVRHNGYILGSGSGRTKKEAEQQSAYEALQKLE